MKLREAKALFFAQYFGQKVSIKEDGSLTFISDGTLKQARIGTKSYSLLLRTTNQLTDQEYLQISKIVWEDRFSHSVEQGKWYMEKLHYGVDTTVVVIKVIHFLRGIGILLPFSYIDDYGELITLMESDIKALNWAQTELAA